MANSTDRAHVDGVLVIGGGYAGVHAARAAHKAGVPVTVLDPTGEYDFVPRLAAVAGGMAPASDATAPLAELVEQVTLGTMVAVGDGTVDLLDGQRLSADAVIVTAGAQPIRPDIDGLERALPLRTSADALALRHAIDEATALVVVGGGATGAQLAGAAAVSHPDLDVHLVEHDSTVLAALGNERLSGHAEDILRDHGVTMHLGDDLDAVTDAGARLGSGTTIDGLVAWAAGFEARADRFGLDVNGAGSILVDDHLRVIGMKHTFAAGDVAAHLDDDGELLPMSAQVAVRAGEQAGKNAARLIAAEPLKKSSLAHRGWVLDLGGWRGVAAFGPVPIADRLIDRLAPILHAGVDTKHLHELGGLAAVKRYRPGSI